MHDWVYPPWLYNHLRGSLPMIPTGLLVASAPFYNSTESVLVHNVF